MIKHLLSEYRKKLCDQEIMLVTNFFNASSDIKAAELLADRLSAKGYGLALNRASPIDIENVNCDIIKYDIATITDTSVDYINSLPYDIRDELIYFYRTNKNMNQNDFAYKLNNIMNLNSDTVNIETQSVSTNYNVMEKMVLPIDKTSIQNDRHPKKTSLLGKLRHYEKMIRQGLIQ